MKGSADIVKISLFEPIVDFGQSLTDLYIKKKSSVQENNSEYKPYTPDKIKNNIGLLRGNQESSKKVTYGR